MNPNAFERLKNDLMRDAASMPWARRPSTPNGGVPGIDTAQPAKPVTQAQIENLHRVLKVVIDTAEHCDASLADGLDAQVKQIAAHTNQIKALEEAICPRVAARLESLEKAVASLQGAGTKTAPAAASKPGFMIGGIGYTAEEGRVASIIAGGPVRFQADFKKAREIVDLLRGS
jgi:hypothetical protein